MKLAAVPHFISFALDFGVFGNQRENDLNRILHAVSD